MSQVGLCAGMLACCGPIAGSFDEPSSKVRLEEAKIKLGDTSFNAAVSTSLSLLPRTSQI